MPQKVPLALRVGYVFIHNPSKILLCSREKAIRPASFFYINNLPYLRVLFLSFSINNTRFYGKQGNPNQICMNYSNIIAFNHLTI